MKTAWAVGVAALLALVACTDSHSAGRSAPSPTPPTSPATTASSPSAVPSVLADRTVWLCRPGARPDPCTSDQTTTAVLADGSHRREPAQVQQSTDLDCFYVYPTVSRQASANADLTVEPAETSVAIAQASRFSSVCRVWAPMYRQRTVTDLLNLGHAAPTSAQNLLAVASLRTAWRDYLAHDNDGRRVVFIGHSQGAAMLIRLLRTDVDPDPAVRRKVALALLLGGNVTVADGSRVGGSFQHLPLCAHRGESGCVIAYSSYPGEPPAFSFFGRAGSGVSMLAGEPATDRQVACVNPAAIGGGSALLHPYFPSAQMPRGGTATPWTSQPGRYRAQCRHVGTATWLEVTPAGGSADRRPRLTQVLGPAWGFHVVDVNLALGDLVADVLAVAHH